MDYNIQIPTLFSNVGGLVRSAYMGSIS